MPVANAFVRYQPFSFALTACVIFNVSCASTQTTTATSQGNPLAGTSWQLVRFQGGDDTVLTPDDRSKYTIELDAKGGIAALCPPGSLPDQIVKQWTNIRSYTMKGGHLFLALMADGGIYEFEPLKAQN